MPQMFVCKFSTLIWLLNSEKWQFFNMTKEQRNANRRTKPSLTSPKSQSQRIWNHMDTRPVHTHNIWRSKAGKLLVSMTQSFWVYRKEQNSGDETRTEQGLGRWCNKKPANVCKIDLRIFNGWATSGVINFTSQPKTFWHSHSLSGVIGSDGEVWANQAGVILILAFA